MPSDDELADSRYEEPECTCPPGWLHANFGWHRGPNACSRYDLDVQQREARRAASSETGDVA